MHKTNDFEVLFDTFLFLLGILEHNDLYKAVYYTLQVMIGNLLRNDV